MNSKKLEAFLSRKCPDIFHSIEHSNDIWLPDRYDVAGIHEEARATFAHLVEQAREGKIPSGRVLVIRGEAGAGKTHLMRAFRNSVHEENSAFFAYMQMTTSSHNYERYILQNVVDSLQQPYRAGETRTSLQVLSDKLVEHLPAKRVEALRVAGSGKDTAQIVNELADRLVDRNDLPQVDPDLIRALILLQVGRQSVSTKVNKYLRAEPLSDYDRDVLGGIAPRHADDGPLNHVKNLALLIRNPLNRAFVVCMDQLEDIFNLDAAKERFPRAMGAVTAIAELPSVVVVVSCLESFYVEMAKHLSKSVIDRLEQDPAPQVLHGMRTRGDVRAIITRRLDRLWDECGLPASDGDVAPFSEELVSQVEGRHSRSILLACLQYRQRCIAAEKLVPPDERLPEPSRPALNPEFPQKWNDLRTESHAVPEEEAEQRQLLSEILPLVAGDFANAPPLKVTLGAQPNAISIEAAWMPRLHLAVTESGAQGGGLMNQMRAALKAAEHATLVLIRSEPFYRDVRSQTAQKLGQIVKGGGRGVIISDADWRAMAAFREFHRVHSSKPGYSEYRREEKPLWSLIGLKEILGAEGIETAALDLAAPPEEVSGPAVFDRVLSDKRDANTRDPSIVPIASSKESPPFAIPIGPLNLGISLGHRPTSVTLEVGDMRRHAAFLGSTGSGKTTAATLVIEQLLARRIPAILVDRKGDLCGYGASSAWTKPVDDPERAALRAHLKASIHVQIFTPGAPRGRNLKVPLMPTDLNGLSADELEAAAKTSSQGLAAMMKYGESQAHRGGAVAVEKAIVFLTEVGTTPTLDAIIDLLASPDDEFAAALGNNLIRFCERTVTDLEILKSGKSLLLGSQGEELNIEPMLRPSPDGRTPLTIISTKFLGDSDVQFWVAQLLIQLNRWLDKHPSNELQGVILLDEADLYLPAARNPVSKQPVENLLRRARSKGFGVFLATQSPGDLDYKCRDNIVTWLVGLISQPTALKKLEPMFGEAHPDMSRLAAQKVGQFHLVQEGKVRALQTRLNAVPLPSQVSDEEILRIASEGAGGPKVNELGN